MIKKIFSSLLVGIMVLMSSVTLVLGASSNAYNDYVAEGHFVGTSGITDEVLQGFLDTDTSMATTSEIRKIKNLMGDATRLSDLSEDVQNKIKSTINGYAQSSYSSQSLKEFATEYNLSADLESARELSSGLIPIARLISGVCVIIVVIAMTTITAIDFMLINIPVFRNYIDGIVASGGSMAKESKSGIMRFRFCSDEALIAIKECTLENGKNPNLYYIWKRIWAMIIIVVGVTLLITGNAVLLIEFGLKIGQGAINIFNSLAS